jgi:hypothetical protein
MRKRTVGFCQSVCVNLLIRALDSVRNAITEVYRLPDRHLSIGRQFSNEQSDRQIKRDRLILTGKDFLRTMLYTHKQQIQ